MEISSKLPDNFLVAEARTVFLARAKAPRFAQALPEEVGRITA